MRTSLTIQDIRNLLSRSKTATAFHSKIKIEDVAKNLRELIEMFELVFLGIEKLDGRLDKMKELESEIKKLRNELDKVKFELHSVARAVHAKN